MLQVDLRATVVPPGTRVWRLFPGRDYKFLDHFLREGVAFLDLPGMVFPDGRLVSGPQLLARILASDATKQRIRDAGHNNVEADNNFGAYTGARRTPHRTQFELATINFYQEAKQGDYVVVPSTLQDRTIFLGRFSSSGVGATKYRYGDHEIPTRQINWLARIDEGKLSSPLAKALRHQQSFSLIERSRFFEVLSLVNGNYTFGDRIVSTLYNRKDDFLDIDSALIGVLAKLAASSCQAIDTERPMGRDTLKAVLSPVAIEFTCSQESDIHSDGFTRLLSSAKTPFVVAGMLALLLALDPTMSLAQFEQHLANVQIINSLSPDDPCVPIVSEATQMILNSVDIETTYQLCLAAHDAKRRAGLDPSADGKLVHPNQPATP